MGRKPKDVNAPKKNQSSYFIFSNERRPQLSKEAKEQNPEGKTSITDISKIISAEWKDLDAATKKGYETKAAEQKKRYQQEMAAYKKTENYEKYQQVLAEWTAKEKAQGREVKTVKGKKVKAPKKPKAPESMPKRNQSSYFLFSNERRNQMKEQYPEKKITELSGLISKEWKLKSEEEKKVYADKSAELKKIYLVQMEEYKKTEEFKAYTAALDQWKIDKKNFDKAGTIDVDSDGGELKVSMPRKPKDDKCPKRPLTSYFLYAKDVREATKAEFPTKPITEIAKEISKKWKLLTEDEKKPFEVEASALKEQYKKDMEDYNGSEAQLAFKAKLDEWKAECDRRKTKAKEKAHKKKEAAKNKKSPKKKTKGKGKAMKKKKSQRMQVSSDESSDSDSYSGSESDSSSGSSSGSESDSDSSSGSESSSD